MHEVSAKAVQAIETSAISPAESVIRKHPD
jgi:hypothetical protein